MKAYTDYPLLEEEKGKKAPVREIEIISFDGDKYLTVKFDGKEYEVKRSYVYSKPGRCGEVESLPREFIIEQTKIENGCNF